MRIIELPPDGASIPNLNELIRLGENLSEWLGRIVREFWTEIWVWSCLLLALLAAIALMYSDAIGRLIAG
jgi:hypothetical protein